MFVSKLHKNESGQAALETAIILIAFVVVASVFAFAILSAGSASTERGEQAIYAGLEGVQSSMEIRGAVIADASDDNSAIDSLLFTVASVNGGDPVNLADTNNVVIATYRDATQFENDLPFTVSWVVAESPTADDLLEEGELAEISLTLSGLTTPPGANTAFSVELKPPTGGVLQINRTTPAALEDFFELR